VFSTNLEVKDDPHFIIKLHNYISMSCNN